MKWMIWADRLVVCALAEIVGRGDNVYCLISIKQYYTNIIVYNIGKMRYYTNKIVFLLWMVCLCVADSCVCSGKRDGIFCMNIIGYNTNKIV